MFKLRRRPPRIVIILLITLFAGVGAFLVTRSRAAGGNVAIEAESGVLTSGAVTLSDANASGGSAAQLKSATASQSDIVLAIAGDIQNSNPSLHYGLETSNRIVALNPNYVLALGDTQYETGAISDYGTFYALTWGRSAVKSITYPAPGNHEYNTPGATGYYSYFAAANNSINGKPVTGPANSGYYAFNVGSDWRMYSMNSEASLPAQQTWLAADLAANPKPCTLFFIHKPYWDYGITHDGEGDATLPLLKTFYDNGGDLVFSGHEHNYQRFSPANPYTDQVDTARGLQSFVVGTGGTTNLYPSLGATAHNASNLIVKTDNGATWGVLQLTLKAGQTYAWDYQNVAGAAFTDSGTGSCH